MKAGVEDDGVRGLVCAGLELDAKPTMPLNRLVVIDGGHRVGEGEVLLRRMVLAGDALFNQVVLVFEHLVDAEVEA